MMLFSHRKGLKSVKKLIQTDSIDEELRNSLWSALCIHYWDRVQTTPYGNLIDKSFFRLLWINYFKIPVDTLNPSWYETKKSIRNYFFECIWYEVYDFIEFITKNYSVELVNRQFKDYCNSIFEREVSAYRFVGKEITQITSKEEIDEIEGALEVPLKPVYNHLKTALELLSDRQSPNYRNSIKESISAVESLCKLISGKTKGTLDDALKTIANKASIHPALKSAFTQLYGYTSNAEGIRHALLEESTLDLEDAKFMLVSCSAFINYLVSKSSKAKIEL